ncbi:dynamin-related GTPase, partial [Haematococcus lacustris]
MDRGTSAAHILRNTHIPLRLGYVAVVNRSQEDINQAKSIPDARRAEDRFFSSKPEYRDVLSHCGVTQLARRLNLLLVDHIRDLSTQRLSGGARIRAVFNTMFGPTLRDLAPH